MHKFGLGTLIVDIYMLQYKVTSSSIISSANSVLWRAPISNYNGGVKVNNSLIWWEERGSANGVLSRRIITW